MVVFYLILFTLFPRKGKHLRADIDVRFQHGTFVKKCRVPPKNSDDGSECNLQRKGDRGEKNRNEEKRREKIRQNRRKDWKKCKKKNNKCREQQDQDRQPLIIKKMVFNAQEHSWKCSSCLRENGDLSYRAQLFFCTLKGTCGTPASTHSSSFMFLAYMNSL